MLNILAWVAGILLLLVAVGIPVTIVAIMLTRDEGQHASGERSFHGAPQAVRLPCMEPGSYASAPEPALVLHKDVLAATAGRPWLVNDIRIERTRNLPGPVTSRLVERGAIGVGEFQPTQQSMGYWHANGKDIAATLAPHVIAAFANARADDTVTSGATFQRWVRDFLTCDLADLPLAVRADKLGLGVGVRP